MTAERQPRQRRRRSVTESLLSIVLTLEAFVVFFVTLAVFGLDILEPAAAFGGGAVLLVLLVLAARLLRHDWGIWLGWVLQLVLLATGLLLPAMYIVAAIFIALWIYCFIQGRRIDRRNAGVAAPTTNS